MWLYATQVPFADFLPSPAWWKLPSMEHVLFATFWRLACHRKIVFLFIFQLLSLDDNFYWWLFKLDDADHKIP